MTRIDTSKNRLKWAAFAAAFFASVILAQILLIVGRGEPLCLNKGCKVVEELVELDSRLFNLLGAVFFSACAVSAWLGRRRELFRQVFNYLCLAGLAAEGVLISFQAFVAGQWCSYCLAVFSAILILNLLSGPMQLAKGIGILLVEVMLFSLLNFNISTANIQNLTLENGTCAITRCDEPSNVLYLIFSQDCPHCKKVLDALAGCSTCEFHFNPVKSLDLELLPGTIHKEEYVPEINRLALRILGIDAIPVLIVKRENGYLLIKGDGEIIDFIHENCFGSDTAPAALDSGIDPLLAPDDGGACSLQQECAEE